MASITYFTRSTEKENLSSIYLRLRDGRDIDLRIRTGYRVPLEYWSDKTHGLKQRAIYDPEFSENDYVTLDENLQGLERAILSKLTNQAEWPNLQWLTDEVKRFVNKDKKQGKQGKPETFLQYFDRFLKEAEAGTRLHQNNGKAMKYRHSTLKTYRSTHTLLTEYAGRKRLSFDNINLDTYTDIVNYFTKENNKLNTIGKHIRIIKLIMRAAREEGLHHNSEIDRKAFRVMRVPVYNVYLTEEELRRLANLKLKDKPVLDLVRDIFLVGCYTAQRFSDYSRLTPDMIRTLTGGTKVIELIQQKTGEKVIIPIKPELDKILKKYKYKLPHVWEQKLNQHIKDIAADAKITEPIQMEASKGGMIVKTSVAKNLLIKTHTARRTGCTNMYLAGVPILNIMKVSGHKTDREFLKYISVTKEETANILAKHPYFNKPIMKIAK